jgi:glycosyltransferase involved in cell wall biosynthesis
MSFHFNPSDLQVVFITYNRSHLLAQSFARIRQARPLQGVKVLCSDDCSKPEHQQAISRMGFDQVVGALRNGGLGRNNNKGLRACTSKYQLMVQDDCMLLAPKAVVDAVAVLEGDPSVGMVRMHGDPTPFPLQEREVNGVRYWVADHTAQAYEALKHELPRRRVYSDQPHVRRRELHERVVGYYAEGLPMEKTERDYEDRLDAQSELFVAFLSPRHEDFFDHLQHGDSLRINNLKHRMDRALLNILEPLKLRDTSVYKVLRGAYRALQEVLERVGILR